MDSLLQQLKLLSQNIVPRLHEATMDELLEFVHMREQLIDQLQQHRATQQLPPGHSSQAHKHLAEEICRYDEPIMSRMLELKQEAAEGLAKFDQSRMQKNAYEASYSMESAFIDQRK